MASSSRTTLTLLCSLAVLCSSSAQHETLLRSCSSQTELLQRLSADIKEAAECVENLPSDWSTGQTAALLTSVKNVTDMLHKHQLTDCQGAEPEKCRPAEVPGNGGLACVTVASRRFCKPLCNHGFDFGFLRMSRPFDECSEQTRYEWQSQYVGGNRLAVCNEAAIQVSGAKTAYFPKYQDCLTTKSSSRLENDVMDGFIAELKSRGVQGEPQSACLVCG
ncbi:uncharacterized protein [Brachyistius frenatus]|uniref:uncharacterized protein n=1 Tax=Brachyistius frenatus TaxID=100188 RepID=UPI0037E7DB5B